MAGQESGGEEAITAEEIEGTAPAPSTSTTGVSSGTKRNAFSELMSPKTKVPTHSSSSPSQSSSSSSKPSTASSSATANFYSRSSVKPTSFNSRDGLGAYIAGPASFPASRVIYYNDDFVAINDMYPKSTVHTLLLPRSPKWNRLHPFDAFSAKDQQDKDNKNSNTSSERAQFLASVQAETLKLKKIVAKELQRRYGKLSKQDQHREAVLNGEVADWDRPELPEGRDWEKEVVVGVHARPSMNHLHVHVLSRDMSSECLRHRKHYNSFNTPFLIDVADFPLAGDDNRLHPGSAGFMDRDLRCWRCGKNFGNRFKQLKDHLADEFEQWKRE